MSKEHEPIEPRHIEDRPDPQAHTFTLVATALMVAEILFGLLNTFHVIHI